jgi:Malectin domain
VSSRSADRSGRAGAFVVAALLGAMCGGLVAITGAQAAVSGAVSIDLGGSGGGDFIADTYGSGGGTDTMPAAAASFPNWGPTVPHPIPAAVWDTSRVGQSQYVIPGLIPGGRYEARLYFMDWYFTHPGQREFDVAIDGAKVLTNFDIINAAVTAGADGQEAFGVEKDFPITVNAAGTTTLDFTRDGADQPQVNAIVLVPTNPGGSSIDVGGAGDSSFTADTDGTGGRADTMPTGAPSFPNWGPTVAHPIPAAIWNTARVGDSEYVIPGLTPGGRYEARLYFMDWYFTHPGQREFDVAIDGAQVLTNFDIIGAAVAAGADGQEAFGVEKDFPVTIDDSGAVTIDLTRGAANQAQINAIVLVPAP